MVTHSEPTIEIDGVEIPVIKIMPAAGSSTANRYRLPARINAGEVRETRELVMEDFSKFTAGTPEEPDLSLDLGNNDMIDPQYTNQPGFHGRWVYSAGGMCYLEDPTRYYGAFINTPLGDYSGDLTIKCRVRAMTDNATHRFTIAVLTGGYENPVEAKTENDETIDYRLIVIPQGRWINIEYTVKNYSADQDGFIQFAAYEKCLIDDIEITTTDGGFIAPPKVYRPEKFHEDGFTVNWDPVDWAYTYNMRLYQKDYLSDTDRVFEADFENGIPEGFEVDGNGAVEQYNGSMALVLNPGDVFYSPYNFSKYKDYHAHISIIPNGTPQEGLFYGNIVIMVRDENGKWYDWGSAYLDNYYGEGDGNFDLGFLSQGQFQDRYYGVALRLENVPETVQMAIDDVRIPAGRDAELNFCRLQGYGDDTDWMWYQLVNNRNHNSYTFTGLDMDKEYYWSVQSQNVNHRSPIKIYHAFSLTDPVALPPSYISTDDDNGTYTANWEATRKATSYVVFNYGLKTIKQKEEVVLIDEDFSKIDGEYSDIELPEFSHDMNSEMLEWDDWGNYETDVPLDDFCQLPGWYGFQNIIARNWLGIIPTGNPGQIMTPYLDLSHDDKFYLEIQAVSAPNETLYIYLPDRTLFLAVFDENGIMDEKMEIPASGFNLYLRFNVYNIAMFKHIKISQDVKVGDQVTYWSSLYNAGADETSHKFTNLNDTGYSDFAYTVTAVRDETSEVYVSPFSNLMPVYVTRVEVDELQSDENKTVEAYYSIDGIRLESPMKGVNIVRYTDGSVTKVFVK